MPSMKRHKTKYPGVFYIEGKTSGSRKKERIYYIMYRKDGKKIEEKAGRQFQDAMTAVKASKIRTECIEGKRLSRKEIREQKDFKKKSKKKFQNRNRQSKPIARSIEHQKKISETLSESEKKLRSLVETANERVWEIDLKGGVFTSVSPKVNAWVWEVDLNGVYTYVSSKVKDLLGYDAEEMIGNPYYKFLDEEDSKLETGSFEKMRATVGPFRNPNSNMTHKSGRPLIFEVNGAPVIDSEGSHTGWIGFNHDVTEKVQAEQALKQREKELKIKAEDLQEVNAALNVLLKHREEDKIKLEEKVVANIKQLVEPYLEQLKKTGLKPRQETLLNIIQSNLDEIVSPFINKLSSKHLNLTPAEIKVMNLVKQGRTTKEIAELLGLSWQTIEFQRKKIRKKLGIKNSKSNLRTILLHILNG